MQAIKPLCWAACLTISVLANSAGWAAEPAIEKKAGGGQALADSLLKVGGDENTWFRGAGLLALSLEMGIPEAKFRETHPGAQLDKLPDTVFDALHHYIDGVEAWSGCFGDKRETGIVENDLFGGGSSQNAKKITCEQAASIIVGSMLPAKILAEPGQDEAENRKRLAKAAAEWASRLRGKSADERMKAWFEEADDNQRRMFLALAIQMAYAPAYPLLEGEFVNRAKSADAFLYLELSAYFRHRRALGKKLLEQLQPVLCKQPFKDGPAEEQEFFFGVWKLLTDYDTLDAGIADWQAGRLEPSRLRELLERSIDQPWAYHSMGIESVSVFRPVMEQNLKTLIAAAAREPDLNKRVALLDLAASAARLLKTVLARIDRVEQLPAPRSDAAGWLQSVQHLRELFKDDRVSFDGSSLSTPGQLAADIVWELWKPEDQEHDSKKTTLLSDWRMDSFHRLVRTARSLKIPAAEYVLTQPDGVKLETYPEQKAASIAANFVDGSAGSWRKRLDALPWNERLMLLAEAKRDKKFAFRLWPRLVEFVDWTGPAINQPASFAEVWRDKIAGKKLDDATWEALQAWIVAEALAGRYWTIVGESSPVRPGISVFILRTWSELGNEYAVPVLRTHSRSDGISLYTRGESFRIAADKLEEFVTEKESRFEKLPRPIRAIMEQNARQEGDQDFCDEGFTFQMIVLPPHR